MPATQCQYFKSQSCRSCTMLPADGSFDLNAYLGTVQIKQKQIQQAFPKNKILEFVQSPKISGFRSKARFSFFKEDEKIRLGYFGENLSFHELSECEAHQPELKNLALQILSEISKNQFSIYDLQKQSGELKNLILIRSESGKIGVKFVLRSPALKGKLRVLAKEICKQNQDVEYVVMNLQPENSSILEGEIEESILGIPNLLMKYNELRVQVPSQSFSQVNSLVAAELYQAAASYLQTENVDHVLDLFCGAGGFLFSAAPFVQAGIGVEISKTSVRSAIEFCKQNRIQNLKFEQMDLSKSFNFEAATQVWSTANKAVIVNPPRRGLGVDFSNQLNESGFEHLLYSSCSLDSLVKDVSLLQNYEIKSIQGFDMFPWTEHMEVLVGFRRK